MGGNPGRMQKSKDKIQWFTSLSLKDRLTIIVSIILIATIIITSVVVLRDGNSEEFTEFYVLNSEGRAYDYPQQVEIGNDSSIIIGIANHEGRAVLYTVEVWLIDYTLIDMAVNVTHMFMVERFNVSLESIDYHLTGTWAPQYEREVVLDLHSTGNFTLFLMMFQDDDVQPNPEPQPYDAFFNYYQTEASWRVVMCVNEEIVYLKLVLEVVDDF